MAANDAHLGEGTVVPDVTVVGEAVTDEAETALLDILLDRVEGLLLGDLELGVGPAGDLDDHVEDAIALVGEKRDVVEGRDDLAVLLDEDAVVCGVYQMQRSRPTTGRTDQGCWVRR